MPISTWDYIKYFKSIECDSPDLPGSGLKMDLKLLTKMDVLRGNFGAPIKITSGFRTLEHNLKVGGEPNSAHLTGKAIDMACEDNNTRFRLLRIIFALGLFKRVEICAAHIHVDVEETFSQEVAMFNKGV